MTILFFEEFPDSSSLQWAAVRADPAFKTTPGDKESLVICFKNNTVYEYTYTGSDGDYSPRKVFSTMRKLKLAKGVRPGSYFNNVKKLLVAYKIHGKFTSFGEFHLAMYGNAWAFGGQWKKAESPVRNWTGRLVGW